jgi:hypothetical protein
MSEKCEQPTWPRGISTDKAVRQHTPKDVRDTERRRGVSPDFFDLITAALEMAVSLQLKRVRIMQPGIGRYSRHSRPARTPNSSDKARRPCTIRQRWLWPEISQLQDSKVCSLPCREIRLDHQKYGKNIASGFVLGKRRQLFAAAAGLLRWISRWRAAARRSGTHRRSEGASKRFSSRPCARLRSPR